MKFENLRGCFNGTGITSENYKEYLFGMHDQWISVKDKSPPKEDKFLFHYHFGTGLGNYGRRYRDINGNSEYLGECYHLVLWPEEVNSNNRYKEVMDLDEEQMKDLEMLWAPLPSPTKE